MRIKPPSNYKHNRAQADPRNRQRSSGGLGRLVLAIALCLTIAAIAGIWYKVEGYEIARALLSRRSARAGASVDDLPTLDIEIGPEAYNNMYHEWNASVRNKIVQLDERDWVQGQIRFRGRTISASIWLEEEAAEHWQESKWSLRVLLQDDTMILGMRSFVMRSPAVYRYLDEWLYTQDLRKAGILAPRHDFAHVWVNGDDWGVYALQEGISDAFLTSQKRQEGVIVRVDDSLYGRQRAWLDGALSSGRDAGETVFSGPGYADVDEWNAARVARDPRLQEQSTAALGLLRGFQSKQLEPSQVFDPQLTGRYIAHAHLWGARYGTRFEGERYYYNPLKSRLEPLGGEALPLEPAYMHLPSLAQYDDLEIMEAYVQEALMISQPEYLQSLQDTYEDALRRYRAALEREFANTKLTLPWRMLSERQAMLSSSLHPPETVHAYCTSHESGATVDLHVSNLLMYPVVLDRIQVSGHAVAVQGDWIVDQDGTLLHEKAAPAVVLRRRQESVSRYVTLSIPRSAMGELQPQGGELCPELPSGTVTDTLQIVTYVAGMEEPVVAGVQRAPPALSAPVHPVQPSVEGAIARHPFLAPSERSGYLELAPGDWEVSGDLVLPDGYGLLASQPVTLSFDPGAILFANGPLLLHGTADSEIALLPKEEDWGGIVVLNATDEVASSLSHVTIRATTGVQRQGWHVSGGVTFYESPVALAHCRFLDTLARDALHIIRTRFECTQTEFGYASAHALRGDFVEGRVEGCTFHDVLGNALDVRGSRVDVRDVRFARVYDHGLSASRQSVVTLEGGRAEDVGLVVSSTDMSHVHAQDVHIVRAWTAGLAAYTGDEGYGPASIQASGLVFDDKDAIQTLSQHGSSVRVEGTASDSSAFEIEELRWRQQVSPTIRVQSYRLGPDIWLVGYHYISREIAPGDPLQMGLYWRTHGKLDRDYTIFVHIKDASGETIAGWDTMPRGNTFPTTAWSEGKMIDDLHVIPLPPDILPGAYQVSLGMYYWPTGERLPVRGPGGETVPSAAISLDRGFRVMLE